MPRLVGSLALSAAAVFVTLVAADVVLRFVAPSAPRSGELHPRATPRALTARTTLLGPAYQGRLISGEFDVEIRTDAQGFRERDLATVARGGILFLGDSYFFGWGVEASERASERLAEALAVGGRPAPVANLALPGFGTRQSLDVLERLGADLAPRLVVLGFFVGNDFLDDLGSTALAGSPPPEPPRARADPRRSLRELLRRSPLVNRVRVGLWDLPAFRRLFNRMEIATDRLPLYDPEPGPAQERLYAASLAALDELAAACRARGLPLLVVGIPDHLQVLDPAVLADADLHRPQERLAAHLATLGVAWLDLLPAFEQEPTRQRLYFAQDKHWSPEGHAFAAELLRRRIAAGDL